jgi:hypothetical protein
MQALHESAQLHCTLYATFFPKECAAFCVAGDGAGLDRTILLKSCARVAQKMLAHIVHTYLSE